MENAELILLFILIQTIQSPDDILGDIINRIFIIEKICLVSDDIIISLVFVIFFQIFRDLFIGINIHFIFLRFIFISQLLLLGVEVLAHLFILAIHCIRFCLR